MAKSYYEGTEDLDIIQDDLYGIEFRSNLSALDALHICLNKKLGVDIEYIGSICNKSEHEVMFELEGKAVFLCPIRYERTKNHEKSFVTKDELIRGNVVKKYKKALRLEKETGLFEHTIRALKEELRDDIDIDDIHANLGAPWIPTSLIAEFIAWLFDLRVPPRVGFDDLQGKYSVEFRLDPNYIMNHITYGTLRMSAVSIIKKILNGTSIRVYDDGYGTDKVLNNNETLLAQEKERLIRERFQEFIHLCAETESMIQENYMDAFGYSISRFDGSYLELSDLNSSVIPYKHQKDAIAHILLSKNVLLAHEVGSGKTLEYVCAIHELLRIGLAHKAMIVVPNNTLDATYKAYLALYESDSVLCVSPTKGFKPANRSNTIREIKSDKYQVIIMAYSSFDMITLTHEKMIANLEDEIRECKIAIGTTTSYAIRSSLERRKERLAKALAKKKEELILKSNETACFDELGVDVLVIDEAHNYKNITLDNTTESIVGVHSKGSKKADNMLEKVRYIQSIDGRVVFSTGTPITNSLADLFVLQTYLQPEELKELNIDHFNQWINTFCSKEDAFEIDVDSKNFRHTTRFSKFHNLPELMSMFSDVCDFYHIEENELGLPDFKGYADIVVAKSKEQKKYTDDLAERTDEIRKGNVDPKEDNLLKVTIDGRKCAIDYRLVAEDVSCRAGECKTSKCAERVYKIYNDYPETSQVIFCDISTPKDTFNIYDELKYTLIEMGIPSNEIAFIHEADSESKRNDIEKRFNAGKIRVLIGSTLKLGTGSNVQERLIAVHHLDVPWRPSDMVQREGRIIRQGNTCSEVFIHRYVTEASFDGYSWQILENKQKFISQFLSGSLNAVHREETDTTDTVLSYSEIKALAIGNPLIKKRVEVSNELESAKIKQRQKRRELAELSERLSVQIPQAIAYKRRFYQNARNDSSYYKEHKELIPKNERVSFGEELLEELSSDKLRVKEVLFDTYQGFKVILPPNVDPHKSYILVRREEGGNTYEIDMDTDKPIGCSMKIDYLLEHLDKTADDCMAQLQDLNRQRIRAEVDIEVGNDFDKLVEKLINQLNLIDKKLEEGIDE